MGFTLVEVMVVILLMGLLAALTVSAIRQRQPHGGLEEAVQALRRADQAVRRQAQQTGRSLRLVFTLDDAAVTAIDVTSREPIGATSLLGGARRIARVALADGVTTRGQAGVDYAAHGGASPTYALELVDRDGQAAWALVLGMTGQVIRMEHEREVRGILAAQNPGGVYAR